MKKFKQTLSGIIALMMIIASLAVMPVVSYAETTTVILDEDCSDAPVGQQPDDPAAAGENRRYSTTYGDWTLVAVGGNFYSYAPHNIILPPVKAADSTGMTLQNATLIDGLNSASYIARKLTQDINAENFKSGVYEITFNVAPSEDSYFTAVLTDTIDHANLNASSYQKNIAMTLINSTYSLKALDSNWLPSEYYPDTLPEGIGFVAQPNPEGTMWKGLAGGSFGNEYWIMGEVEEKPMTVKVVVNMDSGKMFTGIYQDGELVTANPVVALNNNIKTNGLGYIVFGNANGDTKVSNLKVKKLEGYENRFMGISEGFDNPMLLNGKDTDSPGINKGISVPEDVPGATVAIDTGTFSPNNVLKIDGAQMQPARIYLYTVNGDIEAGDVLKGSYKINYRMFVEDGEGIFELAHKWYSSKRIQVRLDKFDRKVRHFASDVTTGSVLGENAGTESGTFDPAKWCDVEMIVDIEQGTWEYSVSQDGEIVASASQIGMCDSLKSNGFNFVQCTGLPSNTESRKTNTFYLDDIKVEEYEYVYIEPEFENLNENFNSWTTVPTGSGWMLATTAEPYLYPQLADLNGDGSDKALLIAPTAESGLSGIKYKLSKAVTDGTLNISYDIKVKNLSNSQQLWVTIDADSSATPTDWGQGCPEIQNYNVRINRNLDDDRGDPFVSPGNLAEDTWYTIDMAIRPASSKYDIKITEKASGEIFCNYTDKAFENRLGEAQTRVEALTFRTWAGENYIDNMKIEHVKQKPVLSNSSIKMFDALGNQTPSITTKVTPALSKIEFDFGTEMADVSGITLAGKDAPAINATISEDEPNKVTATLGGMLAGGETYTLTVPGTVAAVNGETLGGSGFVLEFTTGTAETIADMTGLTVGGAAVTTFAELSAKAGSKAVIGTSAVNASDEPMELAYIVAYYNGNKCLSVKSIDVPDVASNDTLKTQPEFTIEIPAGATRAKVFLWTTLNDMIPYCEALEFE